MKRITLLSCLAIFLTACGMQANNAPENVQFVTQANTDVAWGERLAFDYDVVGYELKDANGTTIAVEDYSNNPQAFVDLPAAPTRTHPSVAATMSQAQYLSSPSNSHVEDYSFRGSVEVFTAKNKHMLEPYGAVVSGELNLIAGIEANAGNCTDFFNHLNTSTSGFAFFNDTAVTSTNSDWICFRTADIGSQDTDAAITALNTALAAYPNKKYTQEVSDNRYEVERNNISTLDGSGAHAFDPTCEQIEDLLDPTAVNGQFEILDDLHGLVSASKTYDGSNVNIRVFGGDIADDEYGNCDDHFAGHEYQVSGIISSISPDAGQSNAIVCHQDATCEADAIILGLLELYDDARVSNGLYLANMSLGGPLPDTVMKAAIRVLGQLPKPVNVIVSAGNDPYAPAHYPATYAQGVTGDLRNAISVGAVGIAPGGVKIAGFNTRKNSSLMAFGVNVCTEKTTVRCERNSLGLNGTSFSTPIVAALAAQFLDARNNVPTDLHNCMIKSLAVDKSTGVEFASFDRPFKWACRP